MSDFEFLCSASADGKERSVKIPPGGSAHFVPEPSQEEVMAWVASMHRRERAKCWICYALGLACGGFAMWWVMQ